MARIKGNEPISRETKPENNASSQIFSNNIDCATAGDGFCDTLADPNGLEFELELKNTEGQTEKLNLNWGCTWAFCDVGSPGLGGYTGFSKITKDELNKKGLEKALYDAKSKKQQALITENSGSFNENSPIFIKNHVFGPEGDLYVNLCGAPLFCLMTPPKSCAEYDEGTVTIKGKEYKKCKKWAADVCSSVHDPNIAVAYDKNDNECRAKVNKNNAYNCNYSKGGKNGFQFSWPTTPPPNAMLDILLKKDEFKSFRENLPKNVSQKLKELANEPLKSSSMYFAPTGMGYENIMSYHEPMKSLGSLAGRPYRSFTQSQKQFISFNAGYGARNLLASIGDSGLCKIPIKKYQLSEIYQSDSQNNFATIEGPSSKLAIHQISDDFGNTMEFEALENNQYSLSLTNSYDENSILTAFHLSGCNGVVSQDLESENQLNNDLIAKKEKQNLKKKKKKKECLKVLEKGVCKSANTEICSKNNYKASLKNINNFEGKEVSCDGLDNDCDGEVDNNLSPPQAKLNKGVCQGQTKVCKGKNAWQEPDYTQINGFEKAEKSCDGKDNDCDGQRDEGLLKTYYEDRDQDGYGTSKTKRLCKAEASFTAYKAGDCNEKVSSTIPGAKELCDNLDNKFNV